MKRILTRKPASWLLAAVLLLTCAALGFNAQTAYAEGGPVITKQPENVGIRKDRYAGHPCDRRKRQSARPALHGHG